MKKILLANLGSRNITLSYNGDAYEIVPYIQKLNLKSYQFPNENDLKTECDFRAFTRDLLSELNSGKRTLTEISLKILTENILQKNPCERLILFFTDQENSKYDFQDTLYEAEIVRQKAQELFPELIIETRLVAGNPTNFTNLYQQYAAIARELVHSFPDANFQLLDAGGTSQMKTTAKTLFDYYLKQFNRTLTPIYVDHLSNDAYEIDRSLSKRYILLDQASDFVREYDFSAAAKLVESVKEKSVELESLKQNLDLTSLRFQFNQRPQIANFQKQYTHSLPILESYVKRQVPARFADILPNVSNFEKSEIFELASIGDFYFRIKKNLTLGIVAFYRLSEEICKKTIEAEGIYFLSTTPERNRFAELVYRQASIHLKNGEAKYGLPLLIAYCRVRHPGDGAGHLFKLLMKTCSLTNGRKTGLNTVRNDSWLAHKTNAVLETDITNEVPDFFAENGTYKQFRSYLNLPDQNVFVTTKNQLIEVFQRL